MRPDFVTTYYDGTLMFQSTHPHGVRRIPPLLVHPCMVVSIHAPAWGATDFTWRMAESMMFQSTHPHGVRLLVYSSFDKFFRFQSTHPHGVRLVFHLLYSTFYMFQSTHPHGVRPQGLYTVEEAKKFQSTHPHGVRQQPVPKFLLAASFNPRTRMGCDRYVI